MRSGTRRGATLSLGLACALTFAVAVAVSAPCRADLFHTIPDLVPAVDVNTGGPYYAPPIPYGHYVGKDLVGGCKKKLGGLLGGVCGKCGGAGCDACGGGGKGGLFHHGGHGAGDGACGNGGPRGHNGGLGGGCGNGGGFPGHGGCGGPEFAQGGSGHGGLFHKCGSGCFGHASTVAPSGQGGPIGPIGPMSPVVASSQCGDPGCGLLGAHKHRGCGLCGGRGCGKCAVADPCDACGGRGCGKCGKACGLCGGRGCAACSKVKGLVNHLLGHDQIKWFVGPGGPVPITPGYTPYVVTTRSPRDFLAFPPFAP